jgi:hypothetical protein
VKDDKVGRPVAYMGLKMNGHKILVGKQEGKRPLGGGRIILKLILER